MRYACASLLALASALRLGAAVPLQPEALGGMGAASEVRPSLAFRLAEPGSQGPVDYEKYGSFQGLGTPAYRYVISDAAGLAEAVGEGIYPNTQALARDPAYLAARRGLKLPDMDKGFKLGEPGAKPQENFFRWASSAQPEGVKLWFTAEALREAGMWHAALKAYRALLVHFPESTREAESGGWGLALGATAIQRIKLICRTHPELDLALVDASVDIRDPGTAGEKPLRFHPGRFVPAASLQAPDLAKVGIKRVRGKGKVQLVQYNNGHWALFVDRKPYWVKGMDYVLTKIGLSPDLQNLQPWELGSDPEPWSRTWWDRNRNNRREAGENATDLQLLKDMGVNTVRIYFQMSNKEALRNLYRKAGIRAIMGTAFGAYAQDSGASWEKGTDYNDPAQRKAMLAAVKKLVLEHRKEPYVLAWCLGNENVYGNANNANRYPATFADFLQQACRLIHRLDPDHPVIYANGDLVQLDAFVRHTPDLDILGCNLYRDKEGAGDLWEKVARDYGKPVLITEFGAPAFSNFVRGEDERAQAEYIEGNLKDFEYNRAGGLGAGNALGACVFEWQDEWWKNPADPVGQQDYGRGQAQGPFIDGMFHEEWFGITSQGDGYDSPNMRQLRKAYYTLQRHWRQD